MSAKKSLIGITSIVDKYTTVNHENIQYTAAENIIWKTTDKPDPEPPEPDPDNPDDEQPQPLYIPSGVWAPVKIKNRDEGGPKYCEPLTFSKSDKSASFYPCNCTTTNFSDESDGFYDRVETSSASCSYCSPQGDEPITWYLYDSGGTASPELTASTCCDGICDTRLHRDDYLPKIPMLNQGMLSGFVDFKYMNEFPGCSNAGLGQERFFKVDKDSLEEAGLTLSNCDMYVDWKMKECISEIPYDALTSQHNSKYIHEKTYKRALQTSKTAGNFILLDNIDVFDIPEPDDFKAPYGFNNTTYNNIFIDGKKTASYWKWNYLSGVMNWQRYFEGAYETYISPGDFFYATLDGPEPANPTIEEEEQQEEQEEEEDPYNPNPNLPDPDAQNRKISLCASGLKVIDANGDVSHIIPSGTRAVYISENIYPLFKSIFDRVLPVVTGEGNLLLTAIDIAGTLATGPQYDNVTTDLLSIEGASYKKNRFFQISGMNENMNSGTHYGSAFNISYCKTQKDIVKNLIHKYGSYIWVPPRTTATITLGDTGNGFVEFDFDMVLDKDKIHHDSTSSISTPYLNSAISNKSFTYKLSANSFSCDPFGITRSIRSCSVETGVGFDGNDYRQAKFEIEKSINLSSINFDGGSRFAAIQEPKFYDKYPRIVLNEDNILDYCTECDANSSYYIPDSGRTLCKQENFCDHTLADYFRGTRVGKSISDNSLVMERKYYAQAINARIDAVAVHPNYGSAIESEIFQLNKNKAFFQIDNDNKASTRAGNVQVKFITYDAGIKIYNLTHECLQENNSTIECKRFPIDYDNLCKCEPIISQYQEYNYISSRANNSSIGIAAGYTPNLSVKNFSPTLKQYGGYSQSYLNKNFPAEGMTANISLDDLDSKIDPEYPDGRSSQTKSVTLPNYHTTKWKFNTGANRVSVSENVDLYGQSYRFFEDEYGDNEEMNKNWKRFTTKVDITHPGGTVKLYNQQSENISPGTIDVKLVNPFLSILTGGEKVLHPPTVTGGNHFFGNVWGLFGPRGDEMSSVTLNFSTTQNKHLLYFNAKHMNHNDLNVSSCSFKIDEGITNGEESHINQSGLINFDDLEDIPETMCFKGTINNNFINALNNIYNIGKEKGPKLIISYQNKLYEYQDNDIDPFSYLIPSQNKVFSGPSLLYEYVQAIDSAKIPYVAPIHKKFQPSLIARYNSVSYEFRDLDTNIKPPFHIPVKRNTIYSQSATTLMLPGVRHYFCIKVDQSIIEASIDFASVELLGADIAEKIDYRSLVNFSGELFMYIGGAYGIADKRVASNYLYMPSLQSARLFSNYCNLSFDIANASRRSTLPNSLEKSQEHKVVLYTKSPLRKIIKQISSREIIIKNYSQNNKETKIRNGTNFRLFTQLKLNGAINPKKKYFIDSINSDENISLVFYQNADFSEHIDKDMLYPNIMYGDLEGYDGDILNQPIAISQLDLDVLPIPEAKYKNLYYKLLLSDFQKNISFKLKQIIPVLDDDGEPTGEITYGDEFELEDIDNIQYNIVQKYAMDELDLDEKYYIQNVQNYENYLGILDVNIFGQEFPEQASKNPYVEYVVKSNRLWSDSPDTNAEPNTFLLNLNKKATLIPIGDNQITSVTMSARNNAFSLKRVLFERTYDPARASLTKNFDNLYSSTVTANVVQKRKYPFINYDLYSFPNNCAGELIDRDCNAVFEGSAKLKSEITFNSGLSAGSLSASTLAGNTIGIGLSYDDGLGANLTSSNFYTKIKRGVDISSPDICTSDGYEFLPQLIYDQQMDPAYWSQISDVDSDYGGIVDNTDKYANEMLFRILYGQQEKHNRERLFFEDEAITYDKLVDSSYEIEAKDIYKEIPYNYDRSAEMRNFYMSHTINVFGTGKAGEMVTIKIDNTTLSFQFLQPINPKHTVRVNIGGDVTDNYTANLDTSGRGTKYDYIAYNPDNSGGLPPPVGTKVGSISKVLDVSHGWRAIRFYTGDPRVIASCSQVSFGTVLLDCPVDTELGPNNTYGGSQSAIDNGGCDCTMNLAPTMKTIDQPGTPYECADGTEYGGQNYSCANYGYGSNAGSYGGGSSCNELKDYTDGSTRTYHFENCRTLHDDSTASIGSSSSMDEPDDYEPPYTEYNAVGGCADGSCRGYIVSRYALCGNPVPKSYPANGFRDDCNSNPKNPVANPNANGCPATRDPGYDMCLRVSSTNDRGTIVGDVYRITIPATSSSYEMPICPTQLLSITYTTDSINITAGDITKCYGIPLRKECKKVEVFLPNRDYYITESIESECDSNRHTPSLSLLNAGKQTFLTVDTTLSYHIGSYTAGDVNEASPIMWGKGALDQCDRGSSDYTGAWVGIGLCGIENEGPWIGPRGVEDFKGLAQTAINEFRSRITQLSQSYNTTGSDQVVNQNAEQSRWAKDPNYYGTKGMLRGPTGAGTLKFTTTTKTYSKANATTTSTFTETTITAYMSVPYRIPLSTVAAIQETVGAALCGNGYDTNIRHPFPDWYGDLTGARKFDVVTQEYDSPRVRSENFAIMNSDFSFTCEGLQSNYNSDVLNDRIIIRPCALEDYACWIKQGWTETIGKAWR